MTKAELISLHVELFGRRPVKGTSALDISNAIEKQQKQNADIELRKQAEQFEKDQRDALHARNISTRGTAEEFANNSRHLTEDGDARFSWVLRAALRSIKEADAAKEKFAKDLATDPVYAMSWSLGLFEAVAKARVAMEAVLAFDAGLSYEEYQTQANREALRSAAYRPSSTSPTSNLMDACLIAARSSAIREV